MTKEDDIIRGFQWVKDNVGAVHILINNAGVAKSGTLLDGSTEEWKTTLELNILGLCIATREAVKVMREEGIDGHIVHINSVLGHIYTKLFNVYSASKHGVTALTETLRQELNDIGSKIKISVCKNSVNKKLDVKKSFLFFRVLVQVWLKVKQLSLSLVKYLIWRRKMLLMLYNMFYLHHLTCKYMN